MFSLIFFIWHNHKENIILRQALQQQEQMIKQREEKIQQLQELLESLQKEQILRERKIVVLKKQRMQIKRPQTAEDIIKAFKELGYDARVN